MPTFALDDVNAWTMIAQTVGLFSVVAVATLWFAGVAWAANDARRRTTDPTVQWLSVLAPGLLFIPGLLLYVALRPPETLEERRERRWELEVFAQQASSMPVCGSCQRRLREDFIKCPYCGYAQGARCVACDRLNASEWILCPYCGTQKAAPATRRTAAAAPVRATAPTMISTNGRAAG